ncbi:hypothetical protein NORO109296_25420 [Nocardiopsis rhodophaea]
MLIESAVDLTRFTGPYDLLLSFCTGSARPWNSWGELPLNTLFSPMSLESPVASTYGLNDEPAWAVRISELSVSLVKSSPPWNALISPVVGSTAAKPSTVSSGLLGSTCSKALPAASIRSLSREVFTVKPPVAICCSLRS